MTWQPVPGEWTHRGMDCRVHGANVPHATALGDAGKQLDSRWDCVACLVAKRTVGEQVRAALARCLEST